MTISNCTIARTFTGKNTNSAAASTGSAVSASVGNGQNSCPDPVVSFADGSGICQAQDWYYAYVTITASGSLDIDLSGSVNNPFGTSLVFTKIKAIVVAIDYGTTSYDGTKALTIGPASSNPFNGPFSGTTPKVQFDREFSQTVGTAAGWAVTAGTGDKLNLSNPGAASVSAGVWILGCTS